MNDKIRKSTIMNVTSLLQHTFSFCLSSGIELCLVRHHLTNFIFWSYQIYTYTTCSRLMCCCLFVHVCDVHVCDVHVCDVHVCDVLFMNGRRMSYMASTLPVVTGKQIKHKNIGTPMYE